MQSVIKSPNMVTGESTVSFGNLEDLRIWATTSTFGGGNLIILQTNETAYYIADRMFTSGMVSSETSVFKKENDKFIFIYHLPFKHVSRRYELVNDDLVVTEQSGTERQETLVITNHQLQGDAP